MDSDTVHQDPYVMVCADPRSLDEGRLLAVYEPDYLPFGVDPETAPYSGRALWTDEADAAMRFDAASDAWDLWRTQGTVVPLRLDGQPNRPLTAYTVSVERLSSWVARQPVPS